MAKQSELVRFPNPQGLELAGRLDSPAGSPRAAALFAHCFSCSKDLLAASRIAQALTDGGFAVLRFDFAGLGGSQGDFADTNFSSNLGDLVTAADWMTNRGLPPAVLIGHSLGGAAVVAVASKIASARAVVTIGAPSDVDHVLKQFAEYMPRIENEGEADVLLGNRPFRITRQFVLDARRQNILGAARALGRPLLVLHAPGDSVVGIDNAAGLYAAARHPKSFVSLDGADHLLTRASDARFVGSLIAAWTERYLPPQPEPTAAPATGVLVTESGVSRLQNWVLGHGRPPMFTDEPTHIGGSDTGYSPFDWVSIGLGACMSTTIRLYADHKGLALKHVEVAVQHSRQPAQLLGRQPTSSSGLIDVFDVRVKAHCTLDAETLQRLEGIADKCPVHRMLDAGAVVNIAAFEQITD